MVLESTSKHPLAHPYALRHISLTDVCLKCSWWIPVVLADTFWRNLFQYPIYCTVTTTP